MGDRRQSFYLTALLMACCEACDTAEEAADLAMETLEKLELLHNSDAEYNNFQIAKKWNV